MAATANKCAERNPCEEKGVKERKLSDSERLDKLEKEVYVLRNDLDRMRWEQAVAETAIGRAIIRGSVSLGNSTNGGFPGMMTNGHQLQHRQIMDDSKNKNPCQKNQLAQLAEKNHAINDGKSKQNGKEECGYFTLG